MPAIIGLFFFLNNIAIKLEIKVVSSKGGMIKIQLINTLGRAPAKELKTPSIPSSNFNIASINITTTEKNENQINLLDLRYIDENLLFLIF